MSSRKFISFGGKTNKGYTTTGGTFDTTLFNVPIVQNQEWVFTAEQFGYSNRNPGILEEVSIKPGVTSYTVKALKFPSDKAADSLLMIPIPHVYWDKVKLDLDFTAFSIEDPPTANVDVKMGLKVWIEPLNNNCMDFEPTGQDASQILTFAAKYRQNRYNWQNITINRLTADPQNHHGIVWIRLFRDYTSGSQLEKPIYISGCNVEMFMLNYGVSP